MANPRLSRELAEEAVEAARKHRYLTVAAASLGLNRRTFMSRLRSAARYYGLSADMPMTGYEISRRSTAVDAAGNVQREWIQQRPAADGPFRLPDGHVVKGVSALLDETGSVRAQWVKTKADVPSAGLAEALRDVLSDYQIPELRPPDFCDDDTLTVYAIPDLHLGEMAWGKETGENYDLSIAARMVRDVVGQLVTQSRPSRQAILLGLGDYFHQNDQTNMTPRSGHHLDVDGRWPKVLRTGAQVAVDLTSLIAQRHDQVTVRFLPGNHDPDASTALTVALSLFFRQHERVHVDESPSHHFYHRFGKVLLGATHGHTMKPDRMAMMLAADRPEDWGATTFRHIFAGHIHQESAREIGAVRVETFTSPAARDAYAAAGGWRSGRALTAITFHRERGEIGRHRVNIVPSERA